jgi:hypothetical protein
MVTNLESRGVQNVWIPGLRARAHPGMTRGKLKTPHCYHLVTFKTACRSAAFCGNPDRAIFDFTGDRRILVLDLFS